MPIIPYDARAAEHHAAERARLIGLGKTPSFADGQIAAVSYVNELVLVTFNLADFQ
jgi:tRNA(fMet)-specific endonuclease VapC